ncbi:membrane protein [Bacillus manliponensis]|uniref:Membrane protein n=1 Tax=Bacillus manliponensis TaxID=574376 RepID=A0A073K961_9BACI|nr:DUF1294 domain-containing protein [Bacillus manliponensis]KEK18813.1 membrane protein [Bacillus manliponensis]
MEWMYLIGINIIAFIMMGRDKRKAKKKEWRTSENMLFFVAAIGGAIGAWLGMYVFRHKTNKYKFMIGMPLLAIVVSYISWLLL